MNAEALIGLAGLGFAVITYFVGLYQGKHQEASRRAHAWELEQDRRDHELASKMIDEYVRMARAAQDNGPHALSRLGLDQLGSDVLIRKAISEMHVRSGADPWAKWTGHADGIDLVEFFRYVRDQRINLHLTPLDKVAEEFRLQRAGARS